MRVTNLRHMQAIPVRPEIVRRLGHDHIAAIYFQQLVFYNGREAKDGEGFFVKSKATIERDTALTRFQQDRSRRKLEELGWIDTRMGALRGSQTSAIKILRDLVSL